jgi:hypothetical protein
MHLDSIADEFIEFLDDAKSALDFMETESIIPGVAIAKESNHIGHVIFIKCKVLQGALKFSGRMVFNWIHQHHKSLLKRLTIWKVFCEPYVK